MLTELQKEKAQKALADHKTRELVKRIKLHLYKQDQELVNTWKLPFRMIHRREFIPGEIEPNDYYPHMFGVGRAADGSPALIPDAQKITPERAVYFFTRHLAANLSNLEQYGPADWTGEAISIEAAGRQRQAYTARIQDYHDHPERYDHEPHPIPSDAAERYFLFNDGI